jgi:hypothetical protein
MPGGGDGPLGNHIVVVAGERGKDDGGAPRQRFTSENDARDDVVCVRVQLAVMVVVGFTPALLIDFVSSPLRAWYLLQKR